mmetsp:Transcript_23635/g.50445  ORF Transcript_23635/g.50445 Transcript_23635/m.50445 type:complete len:93 (+) Transcript_23635:1376-1654(+)
MVIAQRPSTILEETTSSSCILDSFSHRGEVRSGPSPAVVVFDITSHSCLDRGYGRHRLRYSDSEWFASPQNEVKTCAPLTTPTAMSRSFAGP